MNYTWVLYDATCPFCISGINIFKASLDKNNCKVQPLQNKHILKILNVDNDDFPEMKVIGDDRKLYGGARAIVYLSEKIWWAKPLWALSHIPLTLNIMDYVYKLIANTWHCHGTCEI
jgi:predicted DCC family thiol-disulfide oxidoreductase YuxK